MNCQMIRVISSPSSSTTGVFTLIFAMARGGYRSAKCARASPLAPSAEPWFTSSGMPYRATDRTGARRAGARERIVAAAYELVAEGGFRAARVAAVAQRAGVAPGSVYRHFSSKADLFAEVFRRAAQHEVDAVADAETLAGGVEAFARRALAGRPLAWALLPQPVHPVVQAQR